MEGMTGIVHFAYCTCVSFLRRGWGGGGGGRLEYLMFLPVFVSFSANPGVCLLVGCNDSVVCYIKIHCRFLKRNL